MAGKTVRISGGVLLAILLLGGDIHPQGGPSDLRPFVALGQKINVEVYDSPILQGDRIVDKGTLVQQRTRTPIIGSGTVISESGLILTNAHVATAMLLEPEVQYDAQKNVLLVIRPVSTDIVVFEDTDNDPLTPPVPKYTALVVTGEDPPVDVAVLLIRREARYAHVPLGNPFGIQMNDKLTVVGYPGMGGETITISSGEFLGMTHGAIKTNATMAGGSSGGAALHQERLIGIPTAVSAPEMAGSTFGYVNPVAWASGALAFTALKFGDQVRVPEIRSEWVANRYNQHTSGRHIYVGSYVVSEQTQRPIGGALVLLYRADRTFEQILALDKEFKRNRVIIWTKLLHDPEGQYGYSAEVIADKMELPVHTVRDYINYPLDRFSPDLQRYVKGEFFYKLVQTDEDGFYFTYVPRNRPLKVRVAGRTSRPFEWDFQSGSGVWQQLPVVGLYEH